MSDFHRHLVDKPRPRYRMNPASRVRAGYARAALYAHVVEGKLYTTREIAAVIGKSLETASTRAKRGPFPLTWENLQKARLP